MTLVDLAACVVLAALVVLVVMVGAISQSTTTKSSDADFKRWLERNRPPRPKNWRP